MSVAKPDGFIEYRVVNTVLAGEDCLNLSAFSNLTGLELQGNFVMETVGVECSFGVDGSVRVKKVQLNSRWQSVGQGRQWLDENGRHVLIMLPGEEVRELVLQPGTLQWGLVEIGGSRGTAV